MCRTGIRAFVGVGVGADVGGGVGAGVGGGVGTGVGPGVGMVVAGASVRRAGVPAGIHRVATRAGVVVLHIVVAHVTISTAVKSRVSNS